MTHTTVPCIKAALTAAMALALVACGGADPATGTTTKTGAAAVGTGAGGSTGAPDATLTARSLAQAEAESLKADAGLPLDGLPPGIIAAKQAYALGDVARKAAAVAIPVYRFYNTQTGAHFYTSSEAEKNNIVANLPQFSLDGPAFLAASAFSPGLSPVYRFYNVQTGVHFYTISEAEKANILANLPQFHLDGPAYHASQVAGAGLVPLYRFYVPSRGFHFYTASEAEKNSIVANQSAVYAYEGPAYHVLAAGWKAEKLPHTGVTDQQCLQTGSNTLVACSGGATTALNAQQDGHRTAVNPMGYSAVGVYPTTACVRDNVTGLIWESKTTDGGLHDSNATYANRNDDQVNDVKGFVTAVNATGLCGFNDWRLPSREELLGLVDYSSLTAPRIKLSNTHSGIHWSSTLVAENTLNAWYVDFAYGSSYYYDRGTPYAVRLVRGSVATGPRYIVSTVAYGSDQPNNTVSDARTGLQWRRCEEGRTWNGSLCTGTVTSFSHEGALVQARNQTGWRLPNVKELTSLADMGVIALASIDHTAFPGEQAERHWASTPEALTINPNRAWYVHFRGGIVGANNRADTSANAVRLVRHVP